MSGDGVSANGASVPNVFRTAFRRKGIPRIRQITRDRNGAGIAGRQGKGIGRKGRESDITHSRGMTHKERQGNTGECEGRGKRGMGGEWSGRESGECRKERAGICTLYLTCLCEGMDRVSEKERCEECRGKQAGAVVRKPAGKSAGILGEFCYSRKPIV